MKTSVFAFCVLVGLLVAVASFSGQVDAAEKTKCNFSAVYNFGDSNSYTGPFPGRKSDEPPRACNGRLMLDFISDNLTLPKLKTYANSTGNKRRYKGGASFAKAGAPIVKDRGFTPFHLDYQISQFIQLKNTNGLSQDHLSRALYTFDIGHNDIGFAYRSGSDEKVRAQFPDMLSNFSNGLRRLFDEGARTFLVHNVGPIGCLPKSVEKAIPEPEDRDPSGCVKSVNQVVMEFNKQLNATICKFKDNVADAAITYVDVYAAKYLMTSKAMSFGFYDAVKSVCCVNDTNCCSDPGKYISWDGIHYTEAANRFVAKMIINGSVSSPPEPIANACQATCKCSVE